jgi:hypothetical protein
MTANILSRTRATAILPARHAQSWYVGAPFCRRCIKRAGDETPRQVLWLFLTHQKNLNVILILRGLGIHAQGDRLCLGKHEVRKFIPCYVKVIRTVGLVYVSIPPLSPNEESVRPIHVPFFAHVIAKLLTYCPSGFFSLILY